MLFCIRCLLITLKKTCNLFLHALLRVFNQQFTQLCRLTTPLERQNATDQIDQKSLCIWLKTPVIPQRQIDAPWILPASWPKIASISTIWRILPDFRRKYIIRQTSGYLYFLPDSWRNPPFSISIRQQSGKCPSKKTLI